MRRWLQTDRGDDDASATARPFLGSSPSMCQAMALAEAVAPRDTTLLLVGETGTGKSVLARHVHECSPRRRAPFVELNCAALQKELAESELFGHEKGSFTGAIDHKIGLFQAAEGGTLLLDEIGEMDLGIQAKLLRCIETRCFRRLGGLTELRSNVRLIAATHRDLQERVHAGLFREDLFYRLNVFSVALPPLRARGDDIVRLAEQTLEQFGGESRPRLTPAVADLLRAYPWPGNVRELRNALERACILCAPRGELQPGHLPPAVGRFQRQAEVRPANGTARAAEWSQIESVVRSCGGNIKAAAQILGLSRSTLYRKARKYDIPL
jgi:transcriptional regulator with PAS, ATPase and Fis domain